MKDRLLLIEQTLANFQADRPTMSQNNTPQRLIELLRGEITELEEALGTDGENSELADVLIFAITLALTLGADIHPTIMTKVAFNHSRYNAVDFQDGEYELARRKGKQREIEVKKDFDTVFVNPEPS